VASQPAATRLTDVAALFSTLQERNQMTVAYYLILDHKRRKMLGTSPIMHATASIAAQPLQPPPTGAGVASPAGVGGASRAMTTPSAPPMSMVAQGGGSDAAQRRWHLGVQSSMAPADMMLEIFRALRTLQFEWKIVAQYSLKCRPCPRPALPAHGDAGHGQLSTNNLAARCKVKVGLQLYKIQDDLYLLDVRKVDGEILPFMDVCALLLAELKL